MIETSRRSLITGLISLLAAPAIVRASSLMPIRAMPEDLMFQGVPLTFDGGWPGYMDVVRRAFMPRAFVQLYKTPPPLLYFLEDTE